MRLVLFFLMLQMFLTFSCGTDSTVSSSQNGTIYYYSDFDKMDKMNLVPGTDVVLTVQIESNRSETDSIKVFSGKNLYMKFKDPNLIRKGASFQIPNENIEVLVSEWSGTKDLNLNYNLEGTLKIKNYKEFEKAVLGLNFKLRTGLDSYQKYNINSDFECIKLYKTYKGADFVADSVDYGFNSNELRSLHLEGDWIQIDEYFYDKNLGRWMEYFHLKNPEKWKVQAGVLVEPPVSEFKVDGGRIFITEKDGKKKEYLINSFKNDTLIFTNQLSSQKNRYVFHKKADQQ